MKVVGIIQARMGSSRLPGKVLLEIGGQAMLGRVATRVRRSRMVQAVLVATTTDPLDDVLAQYCGSSGIAYSRGSQYDVLDRYYQTALQERADVIVRITADCPLIDAELIDAVVRTVIGSSDEFPPVGDASAGRFDFAANRLPPPWRRTYPIGLDAEACTFKALERAWTEAREPQQREHVMPYMYEDAQLAPVADRLWAGTSPRGFRVALQHHDVDLGSYRWTVDTREDLDFVRQVYGRFGDRADFSWGEVLDLVQAQPELMQINAGIRHKSLRDVDERASED